MTFVENDVENDPISDSDGGFSSEMSGDDRDGLQALHSEEPVDVLEQGIPSDTAEIPQKIQRKGSQDFDQILGELKKVATGSKLYGREAEKDALQQSWERCCQESRQEMFLINGEAGIGKSKLVLSMRPVISHQSPKAFFLHGKFEQSSMQSKGAFEVFVSAFSRYVDKLLDTKDRSLIQRCKDSLRDAIGKERRTLTHLMPAFESLLYENLGGTQLEELNTQVFGNESSNRLRNALSKAVAAIASVTPIFLVLDEIQFADEYNIEVLRSIMHAEKSFPLFVVCVSTPIQSSHGPIHTEKHELVATSRKVFKSAMKEFQQDANIRVTAMDFKNPDLEQVQTLIADLFQRSSSDDDVSKLAETAYRLSQGNILHVFQFLRLLASQGVIVRTNHVWKWDSESLVSDHWASDSTIDLLTRTIQSLPRPCQEALKVASCLGTDVDSSALDIVLQTATGPLLKQAEDEGLLVYSPANGGYRFAHQWIRDAAYGQIPEEDRIEFNLMIGQRLWRNSSPLALEENIAMIVSLVNTGEKLLVEQRERYKVAELNLKAGLKALKVPSFQAAASFFAKGIEMLGPDCWEERYQLSLDLYSNAAEVETINGNYESVAPAIDQVVRNGRCLDDKLKVYAALVDSMQQQDNMGEAVSVCVDVINKLGENVPSKVSKLTILRELIKVRMALRGKSDRDLLQLPQMKDRRKQDCMEFLSLGFLAAFRSKSPLMAFFAYRSVLLSLRYGMHDFSPAMFAVYASTICSLGLDVKDGYRFGKLAFMMSERSNSPKGICLAHLLAGGGALHWSRPIYECLEALETASSIGFSTGYVGWGSQAKFCECFFSLIAGKKLSHAKKLARESVRQSQLYHLRASQISSAMALQVVYCCEGSATNPNRATGDALDFDATLREVQEASDTVLVMMHYMYAGEVAYMYEDYQEAARMLSKAFDELTKRPSLTLMGNMLQFDAGLAAVAACRYGINYAHNLKLAKRIEKTISKWAKGGLATFLYMKMLLQAELMTFTNKPQKIICQTYDAAFEHAQSQENLMIMAIALERHADYLWSVGERDEAKSRWARASTIYMTWGASAKCTMLQEKVFKGPPTKTGSPIAAPVGAKRLICPT